MPCYSCEHLLKISQLTCVNWQSLITNSLHTVVQAVLRFVLTYSRCIAIGFIPDDGLHSLVTAGLLYKFVTFLVYQKLALDALKPLPPQAPYTVLTEGTERSLQSNNHTSIHKKEDKCHILLWNMSSWIFMNNYIDMQCFKLCLLKFYFLVFVWYFSSL